MSSPYEKKPLLLKVGNEDKVSGKVMVFYFS